MRWRLATLLTILAAGAPRVAARAQCADSTRSALSLVMVGSAAEDRRRIAEDLGRCGTSGSLIRSVSSRAPTLVGPHAVRVALVLPGVDETWNSRLPYTRNDGAAWAGRGLTSSVTAGVRVETSWLSASIAPQIVYEQNSIIAVLRGGGAGRSDFASPFHSGLESADLPLRFGNQSVTELHPGESWVELSAGPLTVGGATDDQWWGPGVRNAIVLSNNAAGIPNVYLRSKRPLATPIGDVEFRWLLGGLTESRFFDTISTNNLRALSAAAVTVRVAFDPGLTLGLARAVYAPAASRHDLAAHAFEVFDKWNQTPDTAAPRPAHPTDQLLSLFGRWVFPASGVEIYAEWAKLFPPGLRELLVAPQRHEGYTIGAQWVDALPRARAVRLQTEVTTLEQIPPASHVVTPSFYTSRFVPQGYTQRGQTIGAAIGPGASSQFLAADYLAPRWRLGVELDRVRWENDAYYLSENGVSFLSHDVSLTAGVRGGLSTRLLDYDLELLATHRLNYLFQSAVGGYAPDNAFDVNNVTVRFRVAPR